MSKITTQRPWEGEHERMSFQGLDMRIERYERALAAGDTGELTRDEAQERLTHAQHLFDRRAAEKGYGE
jgi:hypothetical protein